MPFFNYLITSTISFLPKWFAKPFSKPYVAGENANEAIKHIKILNEKGFATTVDILGEHIVNIEEAKNITKQYCDLYDLIASHSLDCNISLKPTHIGLDISLEFALSNITMILEKARQHNNFLRIDMENSDFTDLTHKIYFHCKKSYNNVGLVIQSYLHRSINDLNLLSDGNLNARICKGIYNESDKIAYKNKEQINKNFLQLAKIMAHNRSYAAYATHDQDLLDRIIDWINIENISPNLFEFQVLYGVPMSGRLEALLDSGYKVRVYVPYGPDWFDYSIRRLKENPNIAGYVLKNLFKRN